MHSSAAQFVVLCTLTEAAHHDELPALYSSNCFAEVAASWQERLNEARRQQGHGPCSMTVLYSLPLLCPLAANAFVLPAASAAAAVPRAGQLAAGFCASSIATASDDESDEEPAPRAASSRRSGHSAERRSKGGGGATAAPPATGVPLLAHAAAGFMAALGLRPEAFSLGPYSRLVCRHLAFVPAAAEDLAPAALVLVDRALDPVSPAQHADLLVQRMHDMLAQQGRAESSLLPSAAPHNPAGTADASQQPSPLAGRRTPPPAPSRAPAGRAGQRSAAAPFTPLSLQLPMPSLDPPPPTSSGLDAASSTEGAGTAPEQGAAAGSQQAGISDSRARGGVRPSLLPGSLRHPGDPQADRWLDFLLSRKGRDGPLFLRKWLREAARKVRRGTCRHWSR
jgi:hypothetical protein